MASRRSTRKFVAQPAVKKVIPLKLLLSGPAGSGKTWKSLVFATYITQHLPEGHTGNGKIVVIDTEARSAALYGDTFDFDVVDFEPPFDPVDFVACIKQQEAAGYSVIIVDSISHEWDGDGGCLSRIDNSTGNQHAAWKPVTADHLDFINTILWCKAHMILCGREKEATAQERDDKDRLKVVKLGLQLQQRTGFDYEPQIHARVSIDHILTVEKTRCAQIADMVVRPDDNTKFIGIVWSWLNSGEDPGKLKAIRDTIKQQWIEMAQASAWIPAQPEAKHYKLLKAVLGDTYGELDITQDDDALQVLGNLGLEKIKAHKPTGVA